MTQKKKTLVFEYYNLVDPTEWGAVTFWDDVQQSNF
jgi:hypothetical protein